MGRTVESVLPKQLAAVEQVITEFLAAMWIRIVEKTSNSHRVFKGKLS